MPISGGEPVACDLSTGDSLVGKLAERIACRVVGGTRRAAIDAPRIVLATVTNEHQHSVDDSAVIVPVRLELVVEIVRRGIVTDALEAALGFSNGAVEFRHLLFIGGRLGLIRRQ